MRFGTSFASCRFGSSFARSVVGVAVAPEPEPIPPVEPSGATLTLTWENTSTTALTNLIEKSLNGTVWTTVASITAGAAGTTGSRTISGLAYNTAYYFRVSAVNGLGSAVVTSGVRYTAPELALAGVVAADTSYSTISISATSPASPPVSGGYLVEYYKAGDPPWSLSTASPTLPVTISGITESTLVTARIYAYNLNADGSKSIGPVSATVSDTTPEMEGVSLLTAQSSGTPRNDYTGWVGYRIGLSSNKTVTHVGWPWKTGDTVNHVIGIYDSGNVLVASATVPGGAGVNGTFNKVALRTVLSPGNYKIAGLVIAGEDTWHDLATLSTSGDATISSSVYSEGTGAPAFSDTGTTNQGQGCPTIYFKP